ncbi:hypothetical protein Val02_54100 [Virgisporangium aliadipatigenens]|uniref:Uncharacterized protein n=1 Tax=Virgisporangium aliadipatigenens TaxID=741659 RepID=A0A8J3YN00_9ACTN|nr:hypothetical protein [Virgisporangium aliadipatigenens]GIJ48524.1 hypothetical protein Val02_54100 [Virgisporangium aliadipatigenens]
MAHPLVTEAVKKAAIAWIDGRAVWCAWVGDALYVVTGGGEQEAPALAAGATVPVTLRGDHGGRIVTWPAAVSTVDPAGEEWSTVAPQLAGKRLNASGGPTETAERWAAHSTVYALREAAPPLEAGETLPQTSLAEPPRPSEAARATKRPFRLHRVRKPPKPS